MISKRFCVLLATIDLVLLELRGQYKRFVLCHSHHARAVCILCGTRFPSVPTGLDERNVGYFLQILYQTTGCLRILFVNFHNYDQASDGMVSCRIIAKLPVLIELQSLVLCDLQIKGAHCIVVWSFECLIFGFPVTALDEVLQSDRGPVEETPSSEKVFTCRPSLSFLQSSCWRSLVPRQPCERISGMAPRNSSCVDVYMGPSFSLALFTLFHG